jgi:hypothetical protein
MSWGGSTVLGEVELQTAVKRPGKSHALQITYPNSGTDSNREPNFNLGQRMGGEGQTLWIEFWLRVSGNYAPNAGTKKLFQMWNTFYTTSATIGLSWMPQADGGVLLQQAISGSGVDQAGFDGVNYYTGVTFTPNKTYPAGPQYLFKTAASGVSAMMALDTWHQIRVKVKWASSFLATDGRFQVFVDGTLFQDSGNCNIHNNAWERTTGQPIGLQSGYIMGYANNGFTANTSFFWSDFSVSTINPGW